MSENSQASEMQRRYQFLLGFLIERGVLTDKRYRNGTWSLQGIYGVDDSGLRGAGRTPEEALDNAIISVNLDPEASRKFWSDTNAALAAAAVVDESQQREAFEARSKRSGYSLRREGDEYRHPPTQHAWQGWMMRAEVAPAAAVAATWTLTAPDGRVWQAESAIRCVAAEQRERIPPAIALERIFAADDETEVDEAEVEGRHVGTREATWLDCASSQAALDVLRERYRQSCVLQWTHRHDDQHDAGELAGAGAAYAAHASDALHPLSQGDAFRDGTIPPGWCWEPSAWKPGTARRNLVKAGALILAELERIDRTGDDAAAPVIEDDDDADVPDESIQVCLILVGLEPSLKTIATWSPEQRTLALEWAGATHYRASDNDVDVPPRPEFLPDPWKGAYLDTGDVLGGSQPTTF